MDATLPRVPVYIDLNNDGFLNANEPRTLTNEAGFYNFNALPTGSYLLRVAQPADKVDGAASVLGDLQTTNSPLVVDVFTGATTNNADLGVVVPNSVYGKVVNDLNGNGFPEPNERGIGGITVFLDSNGNNVFDLAEKSTVTGVDGVYILKGLNTSVGQESNATLAQDPYLAYQLLVDPLSVAKSFPVTSVPPTTAYVRTSPLPGATIDAPVIPGGSAQANFLYTFAQTPTAVLRDSITGFVFNDLNSDGIVQPGEPNKAGVQVYLDFNNNGKRDNDTSLVEPASISDASGSFGFFNLTTPGDYIVRTTGNFPTTPIPNVILGSGQAAQLAIGVSSVQPTPPINPNALIPVPGVQVVAQNPIFPTTGFPVV
ncbi:MAG: SdrD B-like domain-containing protein [Planktothrix sp. GU0601_MAG3]|nr:MAG: SdrD B-like domain-containing protein [Planktothrix sp. GU0601_MAG3]